METFKIGICESLDFSEKAIAKLNKIGKVFLYNGGDLESFIADKNAIFVRLKYAITDELLKNAYDLKYICSPTTGLNHIKTENDKYKVISLKGEYDFLNTIRATPEHVFGMTLALLRNYAHAFYKGEDKTFSRDLYRGYELYKNTVGIIGLGRVGNIIAHYYNAFEANVYYYDIEDKINSNAICCKSMEELIDKSNIIILAANYTKENENMISEAEFEHMKGKYFINAARGELVDEKVLLKYIKKGWFKGVAIDVLSEETSESLFLHELADLIDSQNIILTPHIGGATYSSMKRTEEFIADKLIETIEK